MKPLISAFNSLKTKAKSLNSNPYQLAMTARRQAAQLKNLCPTKIEGVILDWSGTTADAHVIAPAVVFEEVFAKHKVPISNEEARKPMGLRKDLHITKILEIPEVQARWLEVKGRPSTPDDVNALFADFVPMQLEVLPRYSTLIPGTVTAVELLRSLGIKIGSTTGFTKDMVDILLTEARKQGYVPDSSVAGDEVLHGARPTPHMIYKNMDNLGIHLPGAIVKVGDTLGDVGEGLSAGAWTVGIWGLSNYTGIKSLEHLASLSTFELEKRQEHSRAILSQSGAHYLIKEISELPSVVNMINLRIEKGETPTTELIKKQGGLKL